MANLKRLMRSAMRRLTGKKKNPAIEGYPDDELQDHEVKFWIRDWNDEWEEKIRGRIEHFYHEFFDFNNLEEPVLEAGGAGIPIAKYFNKHKDMTLLDPLHLKLARTEKFAFLRQWKGFGESFLTWKPDRQYGTVMAFNCIDHFNNAEVGFFEKSHQILKPGGRLMVYYHLRSVHKDNHLALKQEIIDQSIAKWFNIEKYSNEWDPLAVGWVDECRRYILVKK